MKKLIMLLGTLAVLGLFASCSNGGSSSSVDYGTFTVEEYVSIVPDEYIEQAKENGFAKNSEGKYVYIWYTLSDTTNEQYKKYIKTDIFYKDGKGVGNVFKKSCKDKVEAMLANGNFTEYTGQEWLGYDVLLLNKHPE